MSFLQPPRAISVLPAPNPPVTSSSPEGTAPESTFLLPPPSLKRPRSLSPAGNTSGEDRRGGSSNVLAASDAVPVESPLRGADPDTDPAPVMTVGEPLEAVAPSSNNSLKRKVQKKKSKGSQAGKDKNINAKAKAKAKTKAQGAGEGLPSAGATPEKDGDLTKGRVVCKFYNNGACTKGDACPFLHEGGIVHKDEICRFYKVGSCYKGASCPYSHDLKREFCRFFFKTGTCSAGHQCRYSHGDAAPATPNTPAGAAPVDTGGGRPNPVKEAAKELGQATEVVVKAKEEPLWYDHVVDARAGGTSDQAVSRLQRMLQGEDVGGHNEDDDEML